MYIDDTNDSAKNIADRKNLDFQFPVTFQSLIKIRAPAN